MSTPSKITVPEVTVSRPANNPSKVLLPLPEAPMIARNCPVGTENVISRKISTRLGGFSMIFESWCTSITFLCVVDPPMSILNCGEKTVFCYFCSLVYLRLSRTRLRTQSLYSRTTYRGGREFHCVCKLSNADK